jgi:hypothetical protein
MKHYFDGILRRIYKPSKQFFIKSSYLYLSKCTDPLNQLCVLKRVRILQRTIIYSQPQLLHLLTPGTMVEQDKASVLFFVEMRDALRISQKYFVLNIQGESFRFLRFFTQAGRQPNCLYFA